jgi:hypothetical protein
MRARTTALALGAVLVFYLVLVAQRGVWLLTRGRPLLVVFGVAVLVVPLIGVWFLVREFRFAAPRPRPRPTTGALGTAWPSRTPTPATPRVPAAPCDRATRRIPLTVQGFRSAVASLL